MKFKKTQFMSKWQAEKHVPNVHEAMISIQGPNKNAKLHKSWNPNNVLRIYTDDVDRDGDFIIDGHKWRCPQGILKIFDDNDAERIIDFIETLKGRVAYVYVHCDAGISRSAAVSKFIAETNELEFPATYSLYNRHILSTLWKTFNKKYYGEYGYEDQANTEAVPSIIIAKQ